MQRELRVRIKWRAALAKRRAVRSLPTRVTDVASTERLAFLVSPISSNTIAEKTAHQPQGIGEPNAHTTACSGQTFRNLPPGIRVSLFLHA